MIVLSIKTISLLAVIVLTGCSTRFMPLEPTEITIVPREITRQFMAANSAPETFKTEFNDYFARHRSMLLTQPVTIEWRGAEGREIAGYARDKLLRAGIAPTMLTFRENASYHSVHSAMSIGYVYHEVAVTECTPYTSTPITPMTGNCYVENSRFQSMVNPEKMLGTVTESPDDSSTTVVLQ